MLKIGLFTFGGGYAMIALLENEFIEKKKWIEKDEFLNMVAIAESTPGPIAINAATYIGYQTAGLWGALAATVAVCIPSFIIIFLISLFFDTFLSLTYVAYAFRGIQICVIYLILSAGIRMLKGLEKNVFNFGILLSVMLVMTVFSIFAVEFSTVFYILICGTVGVFFYLISKLRKGEKKI
jgi:chromate transporter